MSETNGPTIKGRALKVLRNPHFWVVLVVSGLLLFIYQAWPWRHWQLDEGLWRHFSWLSNLDFVVIDIELRLRILGVLFFIPIIYGSITLSWPGGLLAWLLSLVWLVPMLTMWNGKWALPNLVLLLVPVLLMAAWTAQRRWRESEKRYYRERVREREAYIVRLVETQEAERQRIAQELHDGILQTMMVIANRCDSMVTAGSDQDQAQGSQWIKQKILQSTEDVRRLSMKLRPSILDNFGLVAGIRWLVNNNNQEQNRCTMQVQVMGDERDMSALAEVTVFRVVQEAIVNIQRHSHATDAGISINFEDTQLVVEIQDNGVGFDPPDRLAVYVDDGKLGVVGMTQRVLSAGGTITIDSEPGRGTRLIAIVPYEASAEVL